MANSITQNQINTLPPERTQRAEETINWLFQELKSIFPGWRAAFETEADYLSAKNLVACVGTRKNYETSVGEWDL